MKQTVKELFYPFKVRVDEKGKVVEPLKYCCNSRDCGCMGMPVNVNSMEECVDAQKEWDSAKEVSHAVNWMEFVNFTINNETARAKIGGVAKSLFKIRCYSDFTQHQPQKEDFIGENAIWEGWDFFCEDDVNGISFINGNSIICFRPDGTIDTGGIKVRHYSDLLHELEKSGVLLILKD